MDTDLELQRKWKKNYIALYTEATEYKWHDRQLQVDWRQGFEYSLSLSGPSTAVNWSQISLSLLAHVHVFDPLELQIVLLLLM